jgi:hypothetical protein
VSPRSCWSQRCGDAAPGTFSVLGLAIGRFKTSSSTGSSEEALELTRPSGSGCRASIALVWLDLNARWTAELEESLCRLSVLDHLSAKDTGVGRSESPL